MTNEEVVVALKHLIGTPYVAAVKDYIVELTGRNRVVGYKESCTKDFDPMRVHVAADEAGNITGFHFN